MKVLLSSLLLVSLHSSLCVSSGTFVVTQSPDVVVMEGQTAHIICCWTGEFERTTVNWLKTETEIKFVIIGSKTSCPGSLQNEPCKCSTLTFSSITREDSGKYSCKVSVDVPVHASARGNGTVVTVTARASGMAVKVMATENKGDSTDHLKADDAPWEEGLIDVLRFLPILALVIAFFCLYSLGNKAHQQTPAVPRNQPPSAQRAEENQEDGGRDEEKQQEDQKEDEVNHEMSDNSII